MSENIWVWINEDGKLQLRCPDRLAGIVSLIPGMKAVRDTHDWIGVPSWSTLLAIGAELGDHPDFEAHPDVDERVELYMKMESWATQLRNGYAPPRDFDERLYAFQRSGVAMLTDLERVFLLDEMGTGKTAQALAAARMLWQQGNARMILVVAPNSMKHRWGREVETWFPEANGYVLAGTKKTRENTLAGIATVEADLAPEAFVVVTNWESLRTLTRLAPYGSTAMSAEEKSVQALNRIDWDIVIADEVHKAKGPSNKQTRGLWYVSREARYRWGLTGTPVLNTPGDVWSLGRFVAPDEYSRSRQEWATRYVLSIDSHWGPQDIGLQRATAPEFHRVFSMRSIRRLKAEVLDLPPITRVTHELEMTGKQATAYRRMQKEMLAVLDDEILVAADPLSKLTRLRQLASATPVLDEDGNVPELSTPSNKITALLDIVSGEPGQLVVFAAHSKLIDLAEGELQRATQDKKNPISVKTVKISGDVDPATRDLHVQAFQRGDADVALCTLGAAAEGIDLFASSTAVFLNRSYKYDESGPGQQAESRIHRNGQEADKVTIIDLVSSNTIDEDVLDALAGKVAVADQVTRDSLQAILKRKL